MGLKVKKNCLICGLLINNPKRRKQKYHRDCRNSNFPKIYKRAIKIGKTRRKLKIKAEEKDIIKDIRKDWKNKK